MKTVQEQQLQLKRKFSLGYNKKIVWFARGEGEGKNYVGTFFLMEEGYPEFVRMMEF